MVNRIWVLLFFVVPQFMALTSNAQDNERAVAQITPKKIGHDAVLLDRDFHGLKFFRAGIDMDGFVIYNNLFFLSSINDSVIVIGDTSEIVHSHSLKGQIGFGGYTREFFDPHFYYDNENVYWGAYTDFHIMEFYKKGKKWKSRIITSYENNYLPENHSYIKIFSCQDEKIIIEHARGKSPYLIDKTKHATMYRWSRTGGLMETYGVKLPIPAPVHSYSSRFPSLDALCHEELLLVLDSYGEKLLVYVKDRGLKAESHFDLSQIGCEPYLKKGFAPAYKGIKLIGDTKTGKVYFIVKNRGMPEQLWEIELNEKMEIAGFSQIKTIDFPKYKIQQVYGNRVYYMLNQKVYYKLKEKEKWYICEQEIGFIE